MLVDTQEQVLEEKVERKALASFWERFLASLLDGIIISIPVTIIITLLVTGKFFIEPNPDVIYPTQSIISDILIGLYGFILPIIWSGFTVGKKLLKIQIKRIDGGKVDFWTMFKRNILASLAYIFSFGILGIISIIMVATREDKRSIHDLIAGTEVLKAE
jgi:uncharacterized RDD family membrane protein YckC